MRGALFGVACVRGRRPQAETYTHLPCYLLPGTASGRKPSHLSVTSYRVLEALGQLKGYNVRSPYQPTE